MKALVIYTSETGFTEKYAKWLGERLGADLLTIQEAKKKGESFFLPYDAIVYGGWALGGSIKNSQWFIERLEHWKEKRLALFCVGASPAENTDDIREAMDKVLTEEEEKYARVFYCPGGLNYEKMPLRYRLAMRTFAAIMKWKRPDDELMNRMISNSYDIADPKYLDPLVEYIRAKEA